MKKQTKRTLIPCVAAAFTIGASMMSFAATGWQMEGDTWHYYDSHGDRVTDSWKKSGNNWYWLDENGDMAVDRLIEDGEDHYYVDENGVMVANRWLERENDDDSEDAAQTCWYYFGQNGKAYKAPSTDKTTFKSIKKADGTTEKYAFDSEGRMLYGWVNEQSERQTGEDAWKNGVYYMGDADDGSLRVSEWAQIEVEDDEQEDEEFKGWYWFYFGSNGKKAADVKKTINGKKYRFGENGNAIFNWYEIATDADQSAPGNMFYSRPEDSWLSEGWFKTVPGESVDPEGYSDGEACWFYGLKGGEIVKSQIKKIGGYYYAFDQYGKMLSGLYKMSVNDNEITDYHKIESLDELPTGDEAYAVYYFGGNSKEGAMKTGKATIDLDGEKYTFEFHKSGSERGQGYHGIQSGSIYDHGRLLKADRDEKLAVVNVDGEDYLINTAGNIQKNKKNVKDADDTYYCTDASGVVTYRGTEKWTADKN